MATTAQIEKLRRLLQDFYNKRTGAALVAGEYAFTDTEIGDIIDQGFLEVSDGERTSSTGTARDEVYALIIARADGIMMIAQDEARRIKWQTNNVIIDPSKIAENLMSVAKALLQKYENMKKRELDAAKAGIVSRPTGGNLRFNDTITRHYERNFNSATVQRNSSSDHRM